MQDVMLDLETMGKGSNAAIVAIGAVEFDLQKGEVGKEFYARVSLESSMKMGGVVDASTILWWMGQSFNARNEIMSPGPFLLNYALLSFSNYLGYPDTGGVRVWGNGAVFDNVVLANAYRACGIEQPWSYKNDRCFRTARAMFPDVSKLMEDAAKHYSLLPHHACDDAKWQALYLIEATKATAWVEG